MEKQLTTILVIFALLIGAGLGAVFAPQEVVTLPGEEVIKYLDGEVIKENVSVDIYLSDTSLVLDAGVQTFWEELEDDDGLEDILSCKGTEYDFNEISISKVYDDYSIIISDENQEIKFKVKLRYDEDDERSCRTTYDVSVYDEEDEDVVVTVE